MKTVAISADYFDVEMLERAVAQTSDGDVRVTLMLLAERMQNAAARGVRADYPRCSTCDHWNEMDSDYAKDTARVDYRIGQCEHTDFRNGFATVNRTEPVSPRSQSVDVVDDDPLRFINTGEDFGCVLHSAVSGRRPGLPQPRLKIPANANIRTLLSERAVSDPGETA